MAQSITHLLSQIRGGAALSDANEMAEEVVKAVKATGKKGRIVLTIDIEPDKIDDTVVTIQPSITMKKPTRPYAKGMFFVNDKTGELTREDPRQIELKLWREKELEAQGATTITQVGRG